MKKGLLVLVLAAAVLLPLAGGAQEGPKGDVLSKYNVDFYGYIKLDAVYQSGYGVQQSFLVFAPPGNLRRDNREQRNRDRDAFSMTARQSRFGFLIKGPDDGTIRTQGRLEMDFYGTTAVPGAKAGVYTMPGIGAPNQIPVSYLSDPAENKPGLMLRRATIEIIGPAGSILAGNEWMVVSPIFPHVNNYPYGADIGNLGYRTPQIRLTGNIGEMFQIQVAATNKMGDVEAFDVDTGRMYAAPTWEYGLIFKNEGLEIGYTGHYGMEEIQTFRGNLPAGGRTYGYYGATIPSYSHNLHLILPLGDMFAISGEYFQGANLDGWYTGGQGAGWVTNENGDREPLKSQGGWFELAIKPTDTIRLYIGYGIDDVEDDQLRDGVVEGEPQGLSLATQAYFNGNGNLTLTKNEMYYGNLEFNVNPATKITFEYMQVLSQYDNARHQNGGKYHFEQGKVDRYTMSFWYLF